MPKLRPMKAAKVEFPKLRFPCMVSFKLDGIRAIKVDGQLLSNQLKPIPNIYVQQEIGARIPEGWDGELINGEPNHRRVFRNTTSTVMSYRGDASRIRFYAFDSLLHPKLPYYSRLGPVEDIEGCVIRLDQHIIESMDDLLALEERALVDGYEGLMLRDPVAPYKFGRSTVNEGFLLKLKRFAHDEATVIGFEELLHNANHAKENELGYTARSSHQANKVPMARLGSLLVTCAGIEFAIGTGFTDAERNDIWQNRSKYLGKLARFKHFPIGQKDAPRQPVFEGWRDPSDL